MSVTAIIVGTIVGAAVAAAHLGASWWTSRRLVERRSALGPWLGLPLRVGLPALAFLGLARVSTVALVAAVLSFALVERVTLRRLARQEAR
jgi:hypothetical protein